MNSHRNPQARRPHLGLARVVIAALALLLPAAALAQDLQTDGSDPNGAPPPPPPMPSAGQPGSVAPPPPPGSTQQRLQQATQEDTGVGLHFVYLQPQIGVGTASLGGVLPDSAKGYRTGTGGAFGVGAGLEFVAFQLGARLEYLPTQHFDLTTIGGEIAYQPGSGRFWPRIGLGVGWATANNFSTQMCGAFCASIDVTGLDVAARGGFQYYVSSHWELGADLSLDALFLKRQGVPVADAAFAADGSSVGIAATLFAHVGFHYP